MEEPVLLDVTECPQHRVDVADQLAAGSVRLRFGNLCHLNALLVTDGLPRYDGQQRDDSCEQ
jgi:hypothetical protein